MEIQFKDKCYIRGIAYNKVRPHALNDSSWAHQRCNTSIIHLDFLLRCLHIKYTFKYRPISKCLAI